jgi:hypothetical protein
VQWVVPDELEEEVVGVLKQLLVVVHVVGPYDLLQLPHEK